MRKRGGIKSFWRDTEGVAAVEFALVGTLLFGLLANILDVSWYMYLGMQVENAVQNASRAGFVACDPYVQLPATKNCGTKFPTAVEGALHNTTLKSTVTWVNKPPVAAYAANNLPLEAYYCVDSNGKLAFAGAASLPTAPTSPCNPAAIYVRIVAAYDYTPFMPGLSVASLFGNKITREAFTRLR
jgi:Flp pilus assembly protein TadG